MPTSEIHLRGMGRHFGVWLGNNRIRRFNFQHAQVCQGAPGVRRHLQCRRLLWRVHRVWPDDLCRWVHHNVWLLVMFPLTQVWLLAARTRVRETVAALWSPRPLVWTLATRSLVWSALEVSHYSSNQIRIYQLAYLQTDALLPTSTVCTPSSPTTWSGSLSSLDWACNVKARDLNTRQ